MMTQMADAAILCISLLFLTGRLMDCCLTTRPAEDEHTFVTCCCGGRLSVFCALTWGVMQAVFAFEGWRHFLSYHIWDSGGYME
jgi:hypothetical protein